MANPVHVAKLLELGPSEWKEWRRVNRVSRPDLRNAVLSDPNQHYAVRGMVVSDLEGYDLSDARLDGAILKHARLRSANLQRASLRQANLRYADLRNADLSATNLDEANLTLANCHGADFSQALFWETVLARTNLRKAVGLETVRHGGPSVIDHRTMMRSGRLPRGFLSGIGVPAELASAIGQCIRSQASFASCFISYSTKDSAFVAQLHSSLRGNNVQCWLAEHDLEPGRRLADQIEEAIDSNERVLLVLSKHSIKSVWVQFEIKRARDRERSTQADVLFPISLLPFEGLREWKALDTDTGEDLARIVREFYVQDFTGWTEGDRFKRSVTKLLACLRKRKPQQPRGKRTRRPADKRNDDPPPNPLQPDRPSADR